MALGSGKVHRVTMAVVGGLRQGERSLLAMRSVELEAGISCPRRSWDIWRILLSPRAGSVGKLGVCDMVEALLHGSSVHSSDEEP